MPLDFPDVMGFEIPDDEWGHDDDALLADVDVDAMAAARRSAPPAGPPPARVEAQFAPNPAAPRANHHPHHHPAAPRANHHPHHHPAYPRPDPPPPPVGTGFSGRAGGFSGAGRHPPQQNRWRTGHDAVDRATASGAPRGAVHDAPDADQRTLSFAPAPAPRRRAPPAPDDRQRTLVGMFAPTSRAAANHPPPPPSTRALDEALDDDDWNVHAWDSRPVDERLASSRPRMSAGDATRSAAEASRAIPRARDAPGPSPAPAPPPPAPPAGGGGYGYGYTTPRGVLPPEALGTPNSAGLVRSSTATAGMLLDPAAAQTYAYPAQMARREYQYEMTRRALLTNSLVCLPTGLGKTLIAAVVMLNYHRWFPDGLVVFLAPTRPLVDQQRAACRDICGIPSDATCVLMGSTRKDADGTRRSLWRTKRVFFCTPQTMQNDIRDGVCDASKVVCVVVDEAHRAKGNHAYCQVVEQLWRRGTSFRLLALSATPGHDVKEVQGVVESLRIGRIDFRSDKDPDVKKYTHAREIRLEKVTETRAMDRVKDMLRDVVRPILRKLVAIGAFPNEGYKMRAFVEGSSKEFPQPFTIQMAIKDMNGQGPQGAQGANMNPAQRGMAYQQSQQAWFVCRVAHLMQTNSPRVAVDYVGKEEASRVYVAGLNQNPVFREAMDHLKSMAGKGAHHSPKLGRLTQIVRRHFSNNDPDSRVIVFTSYRDSVNDIVRALGEVTLADGPLAPDRPAVALEKGQGTITGAFTANRSNERAPTPPGDGAANDSSSGFLGAYAGVGHLPGVGEVVTGAECRIKVAQFIGQGDTTKGGARGAGAERGTRGQTQREQKEVLDAFRRGHINTIVATSIGEEGLDIPSVDLIVFFDVVDIIRTIQRMGRTGRARDGRVVVLAVEGREAEKFKREQGRYDHMVKSLHDPGRCFNLCNDCPRMLPEGLHPRCDLRALGPTPEKLKLAAEQKLPGRHPDAGGSSASDKRRLRTRRRDGVVPSRPWDAPLTIVETTLLRAYDVDPEMVRRFDPHGAASLQRRPTSVYAAPHGDASRLMMRVMSAAQGLPPPADEDGAVIPGGAMWRALRRRAEEDEAAKKNAGFRGVPNIVNTSPEAPMSASREAAVGAAEAEEESRDDDFFDDARRRDSFGENDDAGRETPAEAYYAPPAEWDGDRWDPGTSRTRGRDGGVDEDGDASPGVFFDRPGKEEEEEEEEEEEDDDDDGMAWARGSDSRDDGARGYDAPEVEWRPDPDAEDDEEEDAGGGARRWEKTDATQRLEFATQRQSGVAADAAAAAAAAADDAADDVVDLSREEDENEEDDDARACARPGCAVLGCEDPAHAAREGARWPEPAEARRASSGEARAPLAEVPPPSQLTGATAPRSSEFSKPSSPLSAAESARRRLAARQSQSQSTQSQPGFRDDADEDDETLGDIEFHIKQRRLAAAAKRKTASAEKRGSEKKEAATAHAAMPPPPPRDGTPASARTPRGWGGLSDAAAAATPASGGGGWGGGGGRGGGGTQPSPDEGWNGFVAPSSAGGFRRGGGAAAPPQPSRDAGGLGWGAARDDADDSGGGWGAPSQPSQDGGWGGSWGGDAGGARRSAGGGGWGGAWGGGTASPRAGDAATSLERPHPLTTASASRGGVAPTPDSDDLRFVKRRKRRAAQDDEPTSQPPSQPTSLGPPPPALRVEEDASPPRARRRRVPGAAHAASRFAAAAAARRFVDDEAGMDSGGDGGDSGEDADGWCTEDEAFVAPTQLGGEGSMSGGVDEAEAMHARRRLEVERDARETPGSGRGYLRRFGPRTTRSVADTPSPGGFGDPPEASQYGGSFIDDEGVEEEEEWGGATREW